MLNESIPDVTIAKLVGVSYDYIQQLKSENPRLSESMSDIPNN